MKCSNKFGLVPMLLSLTGCLDPSRVAFLTTDNLGINVSAVPQATAEITFARTENVIEPGFENGEVPSVAAAVQHKVDGIWKFSQDSRAIFAGSNAARFVSGDVITAIDLGAPAQAADSGISAKPVQANFIIIAESAEKERHDAAQKEFVQGLATVACVTKLPDGIFVPNKAGISPPNKDGSQVANTSTAKDPDHSFYRAELLFGTDTTIGFKISIPATTASASFPSAHLGYNRNEYAFAPIFGKPHGCIKTDGEGSAVDADGKRLATDADKKYIRPEAVIGLSDKPHAVYTPSFLALIGTEQNVAPPPAGTPPPPGTSAWGVGQVFATGKAAEVISRSGNVYGSVSRIGSTLIGSEGPFAAAFLKMRQKELSDTVGNLTAADAPKFANAIGLKPSANPVADIQTAVNGTKSLIELENINAKLGAVR